MRPRWRGVYISSRKRELADSLGVRIPVQERISQQAQIVPCLERLAIVAVQTDEFQEHVVFGAFDHGTLDWFDSKVKLRPIFNATTFNQNQQSLQAAASLIVYPDQIKAMKPRL